MAQCWPCVKVERHLLEQWRPIMWVAQPQLQIYLSFDLKDCIFCPKMSLSYFPHQEAINHTDKYRFIWRPFEMHVDLSVFEEAKVI